MKFDTLVTLFIGLVGFLLMNVSCCRTLVLITLIRRQKLPATTINDYYRAHLLARSLLLLGLLHTDHDFSNVSWYFIGERVVLFIISFLYLLLISLTFMFGSRSLIAALVGVLFAAAWGILTLMTVFGTGRQLKSLLRN